MVSSIQPTMYHHLRGKTLALGRHVPGDEACLMELVSVIADERWTDRPVCVHPVLASAARAVNDRVSDSMRVRLAPLAYRMIGTSRADGSVSARLVELCTAEAPHPMADAGRRIARFLLSRGWPPARRFAALQVAFAVSVRAVRSADPDRDLAGLLTRCVDEVTSAAEAEAVTRHVSPRSTSRRPHDPAG